MLSGGASDTPSPVPIVLLNQKVGSPEVNLDKLSSRPHTARPSKQEPVSSAAGMATILHGCGLRLEL